MSDRRDFSLSDLDRARQEADAAAKHFAAVLQNAEANTQGLKLTGGAGHTGAYQRQLGEFANEWNRNLAEFLAHERAFVTFLGLMRDKFQQTHALYQESELRISRMFDQIGQRIDEMGK
jgi:hypothetical protein